jgi:hypothetical protein
VAEGLVVLPQLVGDFAHCGLGDEQSPGGVFKAVFDVAGRDPAGIHLDDQALNALGDGTKVFACAEVIFVDQKANRVIPFEGPACPSITGWSRRSGAPLITMCTPTWACTTRPRARHT